MLQNERVVAILCQSPAYRPNFELGILIFELFSASPAIVNYPM